ncbi:MAG: hypothetical protein KF878_32745 [Planctomycetes bacterium]|nr:hypothetical protein [Planctomycetota bacterium]
MGAKGSRRFLAARGLLGAAGLVAGLAGPARAIESDAEPAIGLPNRLGLTGFQDMVDARVPGILSARAGLRYDVFVHDQELRRGVRARRRLEQHDFVAYAGGSAFGLLDASIRIPFVYRRDDVDLRGVTQQLRARYDEGWGDLDVAAKVAFGLGPLTLAPYLHGRMPTGEPDVGRVARLEYGGAATFAILNQYLAVHANLVGVQIEGGRSAFRFRLGASAVVLATDVVLLRVYGYGDGIEYEGKADTDFDLDLGIQAILFRFFTVELGGTVRLVDGGHIDDTIRSDLRGSSSRISRHLDGDAWGLSLSAGVLLTF